MNCWVAHSQSNTTMQVGQRIADLVGFPLKNAESYQVVYYTGGTQYNDHHDAFDSGNFKQRGDYFEKNIKACKPDAHIVQLAFNGGAKVTANLMPIMLKRLTFTGSTLRSRSDAFKAQVADELREQVWPLFAEGRLKSVVGEQFPLAQATDAHVIMEAASHTGKVVLLP